MRRISRASYIIIPPMVMENSVVPIGLLYRIYHLLAENILSNATHFHSDKKAPLAIIALVIL